METASTMSLWLNFVGQTSNHSPAGHTSSHTRVNERYPRDSKLWSSQYIALMTKLRNSCYNGFLRHHLGTVPGAPELSPCHLRCRASPLRPRSRLPPTLLSRAPTPPLQAGHLHPHQADHLQAGHLLLLLQRNLLRGLWRMRPVHTVLSLLRKHVSWYYLCNIYMWIST